MKSCNIKKGFFNIALFSLTGNGSRAAALRGAAQSADGHTAYVFRLLLIDKLFLSRAVL